MNLSVLMVMMIDVVSNLGVMSWVVMVMKRGKMVGGDGGEVVVEMLDDYLWVVENAVVGGHSTPRLRWLSRCKFEPTGLFGLCGPKKNFDLGRANLKRRRSAQSNTKFKKIKKMFNLWIRIIFHLYVFL